MNLQSYSLYNNQRVQLLVLALFWGLLQVIFLHTFGIATGLEATKYIEQAYHFIETGKYTTKQFTFYSTQIFFLVFCIKTGLGYWFVVLVQILFNGLSVCCFYKLIFRLTNRVLLATGGTFFFLLQFYYHLYNVFLYTESLFFSFSILYVYYLFTLKKISLKSIFLILLFLSLLYFTRPTGIFMIPSTILYLVIKFYPKKAFPVIASLSFIGLIPIYFLLNYSLGSGGEFDFLLPYIDERIICGVPTIELPHKLTVPGEKNSIEGLWYIVTHYPSLFLKLSISRLAAFYGMYRPYYSLGHNVFIVAYFYSMYILVALGIKKLIKGYGAATLFMLSQLGFITVTVMLSCDEWHNRFMFAIFPFILITAVFSLDSLYPVKQKNV